MPLRADDDPHLRRTVQASRPTSQPQRFSTDQRPAASPIVFAACAPVANPTDAAGGRPSSSFSQPPATSSKAIAAGESASLNAHWSHPEVRTSATSAASSDPPITNP